MATRHGVTAFKQVHLTTILASVFLWSISGDAHADEKPDRITVATWNLEWFFDAYKGNNFTDLAKSQSAPTKQEWEWKLNRVAHIVAQLEPTILALQEVENRYVVRELTKKLESQHNLRYRIAFIEGWDLYTDQDVAIIYRSGLVEYSCKQQSWEMFNSKKYYNVNKHLFARFEWGEGKQKESMLMMNVHLRATPEKADIRQRQCRLMHHWVRDAVVAGDNVIVLGDMNTEEKAGAINSGSDMDILTGGETEAPNDDLVDLHAKLDTGRRNTHLIDRQFDRILVSKAMIDDEAQKDDLVFSRIICRKDLVVVGEQDKNHFNVFYQIPQEQRDVSDHYPVMAEFLFK